MPAAREPLPIMLFETQEAWADWLAEHHESHRGLRLRIAKKNSPLRTVTYAEALETALCYGWIDSLKQAYDADSFLQSFTPRSPRSVWSRINREKVETLTAQGRMMPKGLAAVEAARLSGAWDQAYASQKEMAVPEDFQRALDKSPTAKAFFESLNSANRYAFLFRIHTAAKSETRSTRILRFIGMLEKGETFH